MTSPTRCRACGQSPTINLHNTLDTHYSVSCCEIQTKRYASRKDAIAVWNRWQGQEDRYAFELLLMTGLIDPDRLDHVRRIASSMIGPTT